MSIYSKVPGDIIKNEHYEEYNRLIEFWQNNPPDPQKEICEKHHILPKSMGGDNSKENLVLLPASIHFEVHRLLTLFTLGDSYIKMRMAFNWMMKFEEEKRNLSVDEYSIHKEEFSRVKSISMKGNIPWNKNKKTGYIPKSAFQKGLTPWNKGKTNCYSQEVLQKMAAPHIGKSSWNKGIKASDETKKRMSGAKTPEHRKAASERMKKYNAQRKNNP